MSKWRPSKWGDEISLEYGKAIRDYKKPSGLYRVYGSNGPVGWTEKALAPGPGVVLGRKGAYRGVKYSKEPFFVIDTAYYVKPKNEVNMRWLYYAIIHHKLGEIDDGSPIPSTTRAAVYVRDIQVPPLDDQRAIASVLGSLDDKIELNRRMNRTLEQMAAAIFKAWFVDFDPVRAKANGAPAFPGMPQPAFDALPTTFQDSPLGPIPKGWEVRSLDEIAEYLNGLALQKFPPDDGPSLPRLKIAELRKGNTEGAELSNSKMPEKYIIQDGDVIFSWSGSLLVKIWTGGKAALNQHLFKVTSDEFPKWFYYLWTAHHLDDFQRTAASKATTMGHIKRHHLSDAKVVIPPTGSVEPMASMTATVQPMLDQIIANDLESRTLAQTRDALLPKLLSGEVQLQSDSIPALSGVK